MERKTSPHLHRQRRKTVGLGPVGRPPGTNRNQDAAAAAAAKSLVSAAETQLVPCEDGLTSLAFGFWKLLILPQDKFTGMERPK